MKHPRKSFVSAVLAVAMVITCFLSFGGVKAAALASAYTNEDVYYFYDCYPTAKADEISASLLVGDVFFDGQNVTSAEFSTLMSSGYFSSVASNTVLIIDIKNFRPDLGGLTSVFQTAKGMGCTTVLLTTYTEAEITASTVSSYLDMYFEVSFEQMESFVQTALDDFGGADNNLAGTCFLIDDNMINHPTQQTAFRLLCESSPFLRYLVHELALRLITDIEIPESADDITNAMYSQIASKLYQEYDIRFLVHRTGTAFRNLNNWQTVSPSTAAELQTLMTPSGTRLCAFGFWELTAAFSNFLYAGQQSLGASNLPVYVFEIDPIVYGDSGLIIATDSESDTFAERNGFIGALARLEME